MTDERDVHGEALFAALANLTVKIDELVTESRRDLTARRRVSVLIVVGILLVIFLSALELGGIMSADQTREDIADCTTPTGECFQATQERQQQFALELRCFDEYNTRLILERTAPTDTLPAPTDGCKEIIDRLTP